MNRGMKFIEEWNRNHSAPPTYDDVINWADEHPKSPWIKCSERMPKSGTEYLPFVDKWGYHYFGMFKNGSWYLYGYGKYDIRVDYDVVVAWMPIPEFKKE